MKTRILLIVMLALVGLSGKGQTELWSMTTLGGANNSGTIYKMNLNGTGFMVMHNFIDSSGMKPTGSLMQASSGKLYGMTEQGGTGHGGVIFCLDPITNTYTDVYNFTFSPATGVNPKGGLVQASNGKLFGMAHSGGTNNYGVLFSLDTINYTYTVLHNFDSWQCSYPFGDLIQGTDGKIYGLTTEGPQEIFSYDLATNIFTGFPTFLNHRNLGSLLQVSNGKMYGLSTWGGTYSFGTLYSFNPSTQMFNVEHDFIDVNQGKYPTGSLIQYSNGKFYGTTSEGGTYNSGTLFSFSPDSVIHRDLHNFHFYAPGSYLINATNNKLFGITNGGSSFTGQVFSFHPLDSVFSIVRTFVDTLDGLNLTGHFIELTSYNGICSAQFDLHQDSLIVHHYFINNLASGRGPIHYLWNWGDGHFDSIPNPTHSYTDTGVFIICLTIVDSTGCTSTYCDSASSIISTTSNLAYITVNQQFTTGDYTNKFILSNILLSPNPFSTQATLTIQGIKNENNKSLSVYNLLGQEVQNIFVGTATSITINRNNLPAGMYFYKLMDDNKTVLGMGKMMVE